MDKNYTPKKRRIRIKKLLDSLTWVVPESYTSRIDADGGTVEAITCLNEKIWNLIY